MKLNAILIGILSLVCLVFNSNAQQDDWPVLKGPYLGQKPPGMTPEIFGKGFVSTNHSENGLCVSMDGKELYFTVNGMRPYIMVWIRHKESGWTKPETMPFSGNYPDWDFNISPDGKRIYYTSYRPLSGEGKPEDNNNIWVVTRTKSGWSEPENLGPPVNTDGYEGHPSITKDGTIYFHHLPKDGTDVWYIYRSKLVDGKYFKPEKLPKEINGKEGSMDPFIAPDESYLIFMSTRYLDEKAPTNFYISFHKKDDSWTVPKNMGEFIKMTGSTPTVTIDGKYFFFNSYERADKLWSEKKMTYEDKTKQLDSPQRVGGIYWVDAKIIENLKPKNLK